ncbi:MAG TPA: polysaccharide biosynthesis protein [Clostridiaceae bacterium]|nr:polysaccharide biosynthesis protein [Clostridiaceae bacterium]
MSVQSTTKGFAVLSAASIIVKVLSLLYIPVLLAIIGEEGNGIYAAAYQVYVFVYVLTNSGLPVAISKLVAELIAVRNFKDAVRSFKIARFLLMVVGIFMSMLMMLLARPLSKALNFEKSYLAILALSPTLIFTSTASAYRGYFQGRGNMVPTAVSQVIEQIANSIFTIVFAALFIKISLEAACAGGTVGTSLGALFSMTFLILFYRRNKKIVVPKGYLVQVTEIYSYKELFMKILSYSIPITLSVGLQYAGNLVDLWNTKSRLLAAGFADDVATKMYSYLYKYTQLMHVPTSIIAALAAAVLPAISGAVAANDRLSTQNKVNYAFKLCLLIVMPSSVGLSVLSKQIYSLIKFGEGWHIMLYGSVVIILMSLVQIQAITLQGAGKLYTVTINQTIGVIIKILINYFVISIPSVNILGSIIGSIVGFSVPLILNSIVIKNNLKIEVNLFKIALKPFVSSLLMGLTVFAVYDVFFLLLGFIPVEYIANAISTILAILAGVVAYIFILIKIKGITGEDLEALPAKFLKLIPADLLNVIREN